MTIKRVCDWCNREVGRDRDGYTLETSKHFVHTIQRSLTFYDPNRTDLEPQEKVEGNVEIYDDCYHDHIMPVFGWQREHIIVPESWNESEYLKPLAKKYREDYAKKLEVEHELFKKRAKREAEKEESK